MWMELTMMADIDFIPLSKAEQDYVVNELPYLLPVTLGAKVYRRQDQDVPSVGFQVVNVVLRDTNDEFVYKLCKVLFDDVGLDTPGRFAKFHKSTGAFTLKRALLPAGLAPFHAGAVKYYKERGVWTDELEKTQKKLLKEAGETR
jgi:TRAP-type uncharacterized transport system substrate-binding protein